MSLFVNPLLDEEPPDPDELVLKNLKTTIRRRLQMVRLLLGGWGAGLRNLRCLRSVS
jgi:hypothetical protein